MDLPVGRKPIGSKWVFKKKTNAEGKVEKYKAWLVEKGYSEVTRIAVQFLICCSILLFAVPFTRICYFGVRDDLRL